MQVTTSIWSRSLNRLFGKSPSTGTRSKASRRATTRRLVMESLENRALFAADVFGSALSIGNAQGNSSARDVATDQAGNSYLTGSFTGIVDFDNAATHAGNIDLLTSRGDKDAYVSKYAPDNSLLWVRQIGGVGLDYGAKIELDQNGNVYVSGGFSVSAIFDSTSRTSVGDIDGFVTKINTDGVFQWTTTWGTSVKDEATGIGVDSAGNAYAIGNHLVGVSYDYDILKFSPSGVVVWSKAIAAQGGLFSGDIAVSASGNVFVAGTFTGTVDFDPSSNTKYVSNGGSNSPGWAAFVLKLNTDGKYGWVSPFVGRTTTAAAGAKSLALDGSGNVVVGGFYSGSVDFNPGKGTCSLPTNGGGYF